MKKTVKKIKKSSEDTVREIALNKVRHSCVSDDIDFDPEAIVVHPEPDEPTGGYWVQAWVYVRKDEIDDEEGKGYFREE